MMNLTMRILIIISVQCVTLTEQVSDDDASYDDVVRNELASDVIASNLIKILH